MDQSTQEGGLPLLGVTQHDEVGILLHGQRDRLQTGLVDTDDGPDIGGNEGLELGQVDLSRQQAKLGTGRPLPGTGELLAGMVNPLRQGGIVVVAVNTRLCHEHMARLPIQAAPRSSLGHLAGNLPIDL